MMIPMLWLVPYPVFLRHRSLHVLWVPNKNGPLVLYQLDHFSAAETVLIDDSGKPHSELSPKRQRQPIPLWTPSVVRSPYWRSVPAFNRRSCCIHTTGFPGQRRTSRGTRSRHCWRAGARLGWMRKEMWPWMLSSTWSTSQALSQMLCTIRQSRCWARRLLWAG